MLRTENNVIGKAKEKFNPVKRFKQLARSALINQQWLSELAEQQRTKVAVHRPKVTGILTNNVRTNINIVCENITTYLHTYVCIYEF